MNRIILLVVLISLTGLEVYSRSYISNASDDYVRTPTSSDLNNMEEVIQDLSEYTLVWSDEFSQDGAVNGSNWFHQTQLPAGGSWYNGELQHYTNRQENSSVAAGNLKITAIKENFTNQGVTKEYTSARLNSKFAFTYGRVDVRAKMPSGDGTWPAIWTLGQNINEAGGYWTQSFGSVNWPACGEIDIMEHWGNNPNVIHGSTHTPSSSGATVNTGKKTLSDVSANYHIYSIIWDETMIQFLIDDVEFYTYNPAVKDASTWPFDKPQYILLNIAMGGVGGAIDPNFSQSSMEIDYVRVYQEVDVPTEPVVAAPIPKVNSSSVISVYSDSYSNISGTNFNPPWNQKTAMSEVMVGGNKTMKLEGLDYQGIELGSSQDVSAMKSLHVDYWTTSSSRFEMSLISSGPSENKSAIDIISGEWRSANIPITAYTVPDLTDIIQLKSEGNGTIFLDNIYFSTFGDSRQGPSSLLNLSINDEPLIGFSPTVLEYNVVLEEGTIIAPAIKAESNDNLATVNISPAESVPGIANVEVTSADGSEKSSYSVNFIIEEEPTTLTIDQTHDLNVYAFERTLNVIGNESLINSTMNIYNLSGLKTRTITISETNTSLIMRDMGVFLVQILDQQGTTLMTKKVLVK